ncbi:polysaccharide deacetylase family protein [Cerasicoccus arenae]|uniref:Polysaccharide deacetylase n=1 Tax=Cerasicoccus arenae TaxID=424488 RepID=A0A8J3DLK4_9BACT|nr:polysaccharide deacetylase family protein [Cerasicoccus arenae]MBK1857400.1 4-deoxy-4-formamido-L-arabinose-phosphoundecaprenol deformylase [Cerasicoccus arenae]GHC07951.1 polysaccharide deacetylase [Cerasicoccus arenae]
MSVSGLKFELNCVVGEVSVDSASFFALFEGMRLALKIDVDTDRGTREGVEPLMRICEKHGASATFLFSLGPDNTGKAIRRIFRPGFLQKVRRTNVAENYGLRTLLNGTLLPAPKIGKRNADTMRAVQDAGFAVGIHCWDHFKWQDYLHKMRLERIQMDYARAAWTFEEIFDAPARCAGAPGWQSNERSLDIYDAANLLWASDTRWPTPWATRAPRAPIAFFPRIGETTFETLHFSTTLPTLDELLGREEYPDDEINRYLIGLLKQGVDHVHTLHAELEGLHYASLFDDLLARAKAEGVEFFDLTTEAETLLADRSAIPVCAVHQGVIDGRSGELAVQGAVV